VGTSSDVYDPIAPGDTAARRKLLQSHWSSLRAFVRRRVGRRIRSRETSLDVAQSVYREALEGLEGLEYRGSASFRRWLFLRAEHKIRDRGKFWGRDKRAPDCEVVLPPSGAAGADPDALLDFHTPSRSAVAREDLERLGRAFEELPPDYRRVLLLARVAGRTHEEIAREIGRTPNATRTILSRALAKLALAFEDE
jgi:RNA polymerase sigma-70 factor (ECF subfamily)